MLDMVLVPFALAFCSLPQVSTTINEIEACSEVLAASDVNLLLVREAGDPSKAKEWLPKDKQYLVTRKGMPLNTRASYGIASCLNKGFHQC